MTVYKINDLVKFDFIKIPKTLLQILNIRK